MKKQLFTIALGLFLIGGWAMAQTFTIEGKIDGVKAGKAQVQVWSGFSRKDMRS